MFVGPDSATIRALGDKVTAKRLAEKADVPGAAVGRRCRSTIREEAAAQAERLGYPVVLKAAAGGGGRGIRVVSGPSTTWPRRSPRHAARPSSRSATRRSSSSASSRRPAMSRCR